MDKMTFGGLATGWILILSAFIMEGGEIVALLQVTAAMIILGGTVGAVFIAFPASDISRAMGMAKYIFMDAAKMDKDGLIRDLLDYATKARKEGILCLEQYANENPNPLLRKGLRLVVDGVEPERVKSILENEIFMLENEYHVAANVFEQAGGYSPTMGIIGTVLGLISVLSNLDDPSELGHKIALAFVATFMGILFANILWLPFANKLKIKGKNEAALNEIVMKGLISIQEGENPRFIEERLNSVLLKGMTGKS